MGLSSSQISAMLPEQRPRTGGSGGNAEAALQRQIREMDRTIKEIKKEIKDDPSKKEELTRALDEAQETKRALEQQLRELKQQQAQSGGAAKESGAAKSAGAADAAEDVKDADAGQSGAETALYELKHARREDVYVPGGGEQPEADNVYRASRREDGAATLAFDRTEREEDRDGGGTEDREER